VAATLGVQLGNLRVGDGASCLIVAEAGSAHLGDPGRARELIDAAVESGAGCVKFQVIFADEIVHPLTGSVSLPGGAMPLYERFKALERPEAFYAALKEHTEQRGALFLASAFGPESARLLRRLGVAAVKVASPELNHFPLLRELAGYGLPLLLSTGVSTLGDIERARGALRGPTETGGREGPVSPATGTVGPGEPAARSAVAPPASATAGTQSAAPSAGPPAAAPPVVLLHCVTAYPAAEEQYNLRVVRVLGGIFGCPVGVSDHCADPLLVPGLAVLQGAAVIEKHLTLPGRGSGLDDPIALEPEAFARMAAGIRRLEGLTLEDGLAEWRERFGAGRVEAVLGDGVKRLAPAEARYYRTTNRSLHAREEIAVGSPIRPEDVCIVRSESNLRPGLDPEHLEAIVGAVAQRRIPAGEGIRWEDLLTGAPPDGRRTGAASGDTAPAAEPGSGEPAGPAPPAGSGQAATPDRADELLQVVDREGHPVGAASRGLCHGNPSLIQAVVHLYLSDRRGRLYLQRRAAGKQVFPGRWDTSVGGHLAPGETPEEALRREGGEELGLSAATLAAAHRLESYLFTCDFESEYVFVYRLETDEPPVPDPAEISEGRFFEMGELARRVEEEPEAFTPHFRQAFRRLTKGGG
jgi:sialic acid synthase SpsE/isopentenyldiphosphate isomerase